MTYTGRGVLLTLLSIKQLFLLSYKSVAIVFSPSFGTGTTGNKPQNYAPHESEVRFFAFASANVCFTCRYLVVYLCFLPAFGYSYLFGVGIDFGFWIGFGFAYTYLYLFMFILRHLKAGAAYSLS